MVIDNRAAFLSLNEAATMLNCSRRFLEIRIEDGELKVFRPSKRLVRIKRSELDRWVESYSAKTGGLT
jgi:excisionase family DNA binding protein